MYFDYLAVNVRLARGDMLIYRNGDGSRCPFLLFFVVCFLMATIASALGAITTAVIVIIWEDKQIISPLPEIEPRYFTARINCQNGVREPK